MMNYFLIMRKFMSVIHDIPFAVLAYKETQHMYRIFIHVCALIVENIIFFAISLTLILLSLLGVQPERTFSAEHVQL